MIFNENFELPHSLFLTQIKLLQSVLDLVDRKLAISDYKTSI